MSYKFFTLPGKETTDFNKKKQCLKLFLTLLYLFLCKAFNLHETEFLKGIIKNDYLSIYLLFWVTCKDF